ncbi:MAG: hypothetical protein EBU90_02500 [Proteobacteria bacterium]|nr:hypothetical protein [Pseudomonadota bacterium]NBP13106.1 hypothetical protein [bacterium]
MFFKIIILKSSSKIKNENLVNKTFFIYLTKNKAYKLGLREEVFDFEYFEKNKYIFANTICKCTDKDIFQTKTKLSDLNNEKFQTTAIIKRQHADAATNYTIGEYLKLEVSRISNIKTKKDALVFWRKVRTNEPNLV